MAKANKPSARRPIRCYLCSHHFEVSARTMSTSCPACNKAIIIEDVVVKSYVPVNELQTCGKIRIMKRGRVAAKRIQSGDGIVCEGFMEGDIVTDGDVELGPKATWKGKLLQSRALAVADGAKLMGVISVPWARPEPKQPRGNGASSTPSPSTTRAKGNGSTSTTKRSGQVTTTKRIAPALSAKAAGSLTTAKRSGTATAAKRSGTTGSSKRTASAMQTTTATAATIPKRTASKKTTKRPATNKKTTAKRAVKKKTTRRTTSTKKKTAKKSTKKTAKKKAGKKTTTRRR